MRSNARRVYADTSVFGGVFDDEFAEASRVFFDQVRNGRFHLVTSVVVRDEIRGAPAPVQQLFDEISNLADIAAVSIQALRLRKAYLDSGIVSHKWAADALHVAVASVSDCALIVSWNFRHITHFEKIPLYNAVNVLNGYSEIGIYSPYEVIKYEEDV